MPTRPADYTNPPPLVEVGDLGTADWADQIAGNQPLIWDFPDYELKQNLNATDVLQGTFVIPEDAMGLYRHLWLWAAGTTRMNSGSNNDPPEWAVVYNGTELIKSGLGEDSAVQSTRDAPWEVNVHIQQLAAVDAQLVTLAGEYADGSESGNFATGSGFYRKYTTAGNGGHFRGRQVTAVDMSVSATLELKVRIPVSSATGYIFNLLAAKAWIL